MTSVFGLALLGLFHAYGGGGLLSGFLHPLLGVEHLVAMLAVGVVSAQIGGRAVWTVPLTFMAVMTVGSIIGIAGLTLPFVDYGIVASVIVLGIAILASKSMPEFVAIILVGIFALFHGYAHGTELPGLSQSLELMLAYIAGFLIATAGLHVIGALIGMTAVRNDRGTILLRFSGALIAVMGIFLIINM